MIRRILLALALMLHCGTVLADRSDSPTGGEDRWGSYLPPLGSPASVDGFWRGVITRDGSSQIIELDILRDDDGYRGRVRVPDWFAWPPYAIGGIEFENNVLSIERLMYGLSFDLQLDPVYGELHGVAQGTPTPITAHLKRAYRPLEPPVTREDIVVRHGDVAIARTLIKPQRTGVVPVVVYVHGRGKGSRGNDVYVRRAELIAQHGIAGFVYDKRGVGESTGDFDEANLYDHADDVMAIMAELTRRADVQHLGLHGSSAGGWVVSIVVGRSPVRPAFVVTRVGPFESVFDQQWHVAESFLRRQGFSEDKVSAAVEYAKLASGEDESKATLKAMSEGLELAKRQGWDEILVDPPVDLESLRQDWGRRNRYDPGQDLEKMTMPVLAFFGGDDYVVDPEYNVPKLEAAMSHNGNDDVTIVVLPGMDHGLEVKVQLRSFPQGRATRYYFLWNRTAPGYEQTLIRWLQERTGAVATGVPY